MTYARYSIYLGLKGPNGLDLTLDERAWAREQASNTYHQGLTILKGTGVWEGSTEDVMIFQAVTEEGPEALRRAQRLARDLADRLDQQAVLVTVEPLSGFYLVEQSGNTEREVTS